MIVHIAIIVCAVMATYWFVVLVWSIVGWLFWTALWLIVSPFAKVARIWRWVAGYGIGRAGAVRHSGVQSADDADNIGPFRQKR